jgi:predicted ATP-grasp superfamily ATP-dependent carboligase
VVAYHRDRLARAAQTLAPDFKALMRAHDKVNVPARARECCIPVPHTVLTLSTESLREAVAQVGLPVVLKPRFGSGADETRIVRHRRQFDAVLAWRASQAAGREVLVQSYFDGVGIGFGGLVWEGRVFALSGHRRLREIPVSGGTSTARTTFDHQEIRDATERLLPRLGINGVVMAEYRYNSATGAFCLLELNPRYWGGVPTAIESGVDFPALHLEAAMGRPAPSVPLLPSRQVEGRWLLGEARALVELLYNRRWREAGLMFSLRPDCELYWDDIDWWRPAAFFHQTRAYYKNLKQHGSFGGHRNTKAAFFARAIAEAGGVP